MESVAANSIEEERKLLIAAYWNNQQYGTDTNYVAFMQVMEQRKKIAHDLLYTPSEESKAHLRLMLEDCNDRIKLILGI